MLYDSRNNAIYLYITQHPSSGLNPNAIGKMKSLNQNLDENSMIDLSLKTSYNLDIEHVRLLSQSLRLVSRYIPHSFILTDIYVINYKTTTIT